MKIALVTTTINVPRILELMRRYNSDARFFIVGDLRTPHTECQELAARIGNAEYLHPNYQKMLKYKCGEILGWNCIQRRNIGFLEALRWGADMIITWDDDNLPLSTDYVARFRDQLNFPHTGLKLFSSTGWFSAYGSMRHRGFPITKQSIWVIDFIVDAKVGVVAGMCLGNPDVDAVERIASPVDCDRPGVCVQVGYVVDVDTRTVFNSQNTAFLTKFLPAMFMMPSVGRHDDIIASLLMQRVMRDRGYHVHFGLPFVWQQRNPHDLMQDLKDEIWGMEHILEISHWIDGMPMIETIEETVRAFYGCPILPGKAQEAGLAWLEDLQDVKKNR